MLQLHANIQEPGLRFIGMREFDELSQESGSLAEQFIEVDADVLRYLDHRGQHLQQIHLKILIRRLAVG
ncbi:hypothetical protein D3C76_1594030 [compost metagenome]